MPAAMQMSFDALEILTGEPANCLKLYAWLCVHMDRKEGLVGKRRHISEQYAKERLEVAAVQGRKLAVPSRSEIRSVFKRLETLGLLIPIADQTFVFSMPYEYALYSVQNNNSQTVAKQQPIKVYDLIKETIPTKPDGLGNSSQPLQSINQSNNAADFVMHEQWGFGEFFAARAAMMGFETDGRDKALTDAALVDLRLYWQAERPNERRNQTAWERTLLQTMKRMRDYSQQAGQGKAQTGKAVATQGVGIPNVPRDNDALEDWAKRQGAPLPSTETYDQYRRVLTIWRDQQLAPRAKQG